MTSVRGDSAAVSPIDGCSVGPQPQQQQQQPQPLQQQQQQQKAATETSWIDVERPPDDQQYDERRQLMINSNDEPKPEMKNAWTADVRQSDIGVESTASDVGCRFLGDGQSLQPQRQDELQQQQPLLSMETRLVDVSDAGGGNVWMRVETDL